MLNIEIVRYGFGFRVRRNDEERSKLSSPNVNNSPYSSFTVGIIIGVFNPLSHAHNTSFFWPHWHEISSAVTARLRKGDITRMRRGIENPDDDPGGE